MATDKALFVSIVIPSVCFSGLIANVLVIILMCRKKLRGETTCLFLSTLAVVDSGYLLVSGVTKWLASDFNITFDSDTTCGAYVAVRTTFMTLEGWVLVLITVERLVAVYKPSVIPEWFSLRRGVAAVVATVLCCCAFNAPKLWLATIESSSNDTRRCIFSDKIHYQTKLWGVAMVCVTFVIPYILIIISNIAIVRKVMVTAKAVSRFMDDSNYLAGVKQRRSLTLTLVLVTTTYVALTSSVFAYIVYTSRSETIGVTKMLTDSDWFQLISSTLSLFNAAINIFLYTLAGSRFRKEFLVMCKCHRPNEPLPAPGMVPPKLPIATVSSNAFITRQSVETIM